MSNHTELPWRNPEGSITVRTMPACGIKICDMSSIAPVDVQEANAAYIVKAANNYPAMLSFIQAVTVFAEHFKADFKQLETLEETAQTLLDRHFADMEAKS